MAKVKGSWTPARRRKFKETMAAKKVERENGEKLDGALTQAERRDEALRSVLSQPRPPLEFHYDKLAILNKFLSIVEKIL